MIEGPKASGKTETARQVAASEVRFDVDPSALQAASVDPSLLLGGAVPRLLDEWQLAPALWNHVRRAIDDRRAAGQFILTGSAVPTDDVTRHTGAGRMARLRMRPMSLFESGHASGEVSLSGVVDGVAHDPEKVLLLMRSLARHVSTMVSLATRVGMWMPSMRRWRRTPSVRTTMLSLA